MTPRLGVIGAMTEDGLIGDYASNKFPWDVPDDLFHFMSRTIDSVVFMGRRTFESIGRPLHRRLNVVISRTMPLTPDVTVVPSFHSALSFWNRMEPELARDGWFIGGREIWEKLASQKTKWISRVSITMIDQSVVRPVDKPIHFDLRRFVKNKENWSVTTQKIRGGEIFEYNDIKF